MAALNSEREALHTRLTAIQIDQGVITAATKRGLRPTAIADSDNVAAYTTNVGAPSYATAWNGPGLGGRFCARAPGGEATVDDGGAVHDFIDKLTGLRMKAIFFVAQMNSCIKKLFDVSRCF